MSLTPAADSSAESDLGSEFSTGLKTVNNEEEKRNPALVSRIDPSILGQGLLVSGLSITTTSHSLYSASTLFKYVESSLVEKRQYR